MPTHPNHVFDLADFIQRCSRTESATPATSPQPMPGSAPTSRGLTEAEDSYRDALVQNTRDPQWCQRFARCLHPPHLYPPRNAQPFYLRARFACNWGREETMTFPCGLWTKRVLDWYVPKGYLYTTRLAYFDVCANYSEVCFGFRLYRNDKLWFDGDVIETDHGNGVTSKMPPMGHMGTFYNRDSIQDAANAAHIIDFPTTFEPGEKITIEVTKNSGITDAKISANLRLTGYLYPQNQQDN
jgi:hypothetical protein